MGQVYYDVPMIRQESNPICWLACVAMIMSHDQQATVTIGSLNGGADPSNSCISNPARSLTEFYQRLEAYGFTSTNPRACPAPAFAENLLTDHGPFILTHLVQNFPYGAQWAHFRGNPNDTHAVVITGVDTDSGIAWMNNPWGDKDQSLPLNTVLSSMSALFAQDIRSVAYLN
jgi:hypothetical protein